MGSKLDPRFRPARRPTKPAVDKPTPDTTAAANSAQTAATEDPGGVAQQATHFQASDNSRDALRQLALDTRQGVADETTKAAMRPGLGGLLQRSMPGGERGAKVAVAGFALLAAFAPSVAQAKVSAPADNPVRIVAQTVHESGFEDALAELSSLGGGGPQGEKWSTGQRNAVMARIEQVTFDQTYTVEGNQVPEKAQTPLDDQAPKSTVSADGLEKLDATQISAKSRGEREISVNVSHELGQEVALQRLQEQARERLAELEDQGVRIEWDGNQCHFNGPLEGTLTVTDSSVDVELDRNGRANFVRKSRIRDSLRDMINEALADPAPDSPT